MENLASVEAKVIETNEEKLNHKAQKKAKAYQRIHLRLMLLRLGVNVVFILTLIFSGVSYEFTQFLYKLTSLHFLAIAAYFSSFAFAYGLFFLPLSFYEGYTLEHRFGLSTEKAYVWFLDFVKAFFLDLLIGAILVEIVYLFFYALPNFWWLAAAGVLIIFSVILSNLAPVLILPLFFKSYPLKDEIVKRRLLDLVKKAGLKAKNVYEIKLSEKTKTAEAALAGMGNTRRVLISDTLLANYELSEIEAVFAHELGHEVKRHIPKLILSQSFLIIFGLYLTDFFLKQAVFFFNLGKFDSVSNFPMLILILAVFAVITLPISNGYSRKLEQEADIYSLRLTKKSEFFISAMRKLAKQNLSDESPHPFIEFFLYSHPPIGKRIKLAENFR